MTRHRRGSQNRIHAPSVFLAHSSRDKAFVRHLACDLSRHHVKVWVDDAELCVGDSLTEKIAQAITRSEYLGIVLSPHSVVSNWVRRELEVALTHELESGNTKVLPILYRTCAVPEFLKGRVWADFRGRDSYQKGLSTLLRRFGLERAIDTRDHLRRDPVTRRLSISVKTPWSTLAIRVGLRLGLLELRNGVVSLSDLFLSKLEERGSEVLAGQVRPRWQDVVCLSFWDVVTNSCTDKWFPPVSEREAMLLFKEVPLQVGQHMLSVAAGLGIVTTEGRIGWRPAAREEYSTAVSYALDQWRGRKTRDAIALCLVRVACDMALARSLAQGNGDLRCAVPLALAVTAVTVDVARLSRLQRRVETLS